MVSNRDIAFRFILLLPLEFGLMLDRIAPSWLIVLFLYCYAIFALGIVLFKNSAATVIIALILVMLLISFDWPVDSYSEISAFFSYFIAFNLFIIITSFKVIDVRFLHLTIKALLISVIFINWLNVIFLDSSATNFVQEAIFIYLTYDIMLRFLLKKSILTHCALSIFSFGNLWIFYVLNTELQLRAILIYIPVFLTITLATLVRFNQWYRLMKVSLFWGTFSAFLSVVPLMYSSVRDYQPGSIDDRIAILSAIYDMWQENPISLLTGVGLGMGDVLRFDISHLRSGLCGDKCLYNSHSGFTTMVLDVGIIPLLFYVCALFYVAITSVRLCGEPDRRVELIAIKVTLILIFIVMNFFGNFAMGFTKLSDLSFFVTFLGMLMFNNYSFKTTNHQM